jgi:hypothetical protein
MTNERNKTLKGTSPISFINPTSSTPPTMNPKIPNKIATTTMTKKIKFNANMQNATKAPIQKNLILIHLINLS